jgi:hypothetical protein
MTYKKITLITNLVRRTPEWIRRDLLVNDSTGRQLAEEALAAMIAAAFADDIGKST